MSTSYKILLLLFCITAIMRLSELVLARRNLRKRQENEVLTEEKEFYFPFFFLLHSSFLIAVPLEVFYFQRELSIILLALSTGILCLAFILRFHVLYIMRENWNVRVIVNPEKTDSIVTEGIYSYIRHPNYLVVILEIIGLSLFHSAFYSFIIFSIANFIILFYRIRTEEKALFRNPAYATHFSSKKRFIPGIF